MMTTAIDQRKVADFSLHVYRNAGIFSILAVGVFSNSIVLGFGSERDSFLIGSAILGFIFGAGLLVWNALYVNARETYNRNPNCARVADQSALGWVLPVVLALITWMVIETVLLFTLKVV